MLCELKSSYKLAEKIDLIMKSIRNLILVLVLLFVNAVSNKGIVAQSIINPNGDTIIRVHPNNTITDGHTGYMGKIESNGEVYNWRNILIGRLEYSTNKVYTPFNEEMATLSNNTIIDSEINEQYTIVNSQVFDSENNLIGSFENMGLLEAVYLIIFFQSSF